MSECYVRDGYLVAKFDEGAVQQGQQYKVLSSGYDWIKISLRGAPYYSFERVFNDMPERDDTSPRRARRSSRRTDSDT
jgi:hypothetical protein